MNVVRAGNTRVMTYTAEDIDALKVKADTALDILRDSFQEVTSLLLEMLGDDDLEEVMSMTNEERTGEDRAGAD